jgi:hypothetical protein
MLTYSVGLLLPNNLDCVESASPTSQVYASPTVTQINTEYHILWRYAARQWYNVPKNNCE